MKRCQDVDAIMTAYVDGELDQTEQESVAAHLAVCPPCRERARAESTVRVVLQGKAARLGERASPALRARCASMRPSEGDRDGHRWPGRVSGWVPLSMAATVLLAVGAVFIWGQSQRLDAAFAAQLAIDHDRCFAARRSGGEPLDDQAARQILAREFGLDVSIPMESAEFDVLEVRECLYDHGPMAHVLCAWKGEPVSLFVVPDRSDREQALEIVAHDAVIWSRDNNAYVLVTEKGPVEAGALTEYVRQYTD